MRKKKMTDRQRLGSVVNELDKCLQLHAIRIDDLNRAVQDLQQHVATFKPIIEGRCGQCPACGAWAHAAPLCEGVPFKCPDCETELVWNVVQGKDKQDGMRYVLNIMAGKEF